MRKIYAAMAVLACLGVASFSYGADAAKPATKPAAAPAAQPAAQPAAPAAQPAAAPAANPSFFLITEKEEFEKIKKENSRRAFLEQAKIHIFKKRVPFFASKLKEALTEEQKNKIYAIQEEYHEVTMFLNARLANLKKESNDKILAVLNDSQKKDFNSQEEVKKTVKKKKADDYKVKQKENRAKKSKEKATKKEKK